MVLHFNKPDSILASNFLCQSWLKLPKLFWRIAKSLNEDDNDGEKKIHKSTEVLKATIY